jgi:hypothetical protein
MPEVRVEGMPKHCSEIREIRVVTFYIASECSGYVLHHMP